MFEKLCLDAVMPSVLGSNGRILKLLSRFYHCDRDLLPGISAAECISCGRPRSVHIIGPAGSI